MEALLLIVPFVFALIVLTIYFWNEAAKDDKKFENGKSDPLDGTAIRTGRDVKYQSSFTVKLGPLTNDLDKLDHNFLESLSFDQLTSLLFIEKRSDKLNLVQTELNRRKLECTNTLTNDELISSLTESLSVEDYETAAKLRDELKLRNKQFVQ